MGATGLINAMVSLLEGIEGIEQVLAEAYRWPEVFPGATVEITKLVPGANQELNGPEILTTTLSVSIINLVSSADTASTARDEVLSLALQLRRAVQDDPTLGSAAVEAAVGSAELAWQSRGDQDYVVIVTKVVATTVES